MNFYIITGVALVVILLLVVIIIADSNRFLIREYSVSSKKVLSDHTILFLSDLHGKEYDRGNKKLLDAIEKIHPDLVLIGGDIYTAYPGESFEVAKNFVIELSKKYRIIYAEGNHEYRSRIYKDVYGTLRSDFDREIGKYGVEIIANRTVDAFEDLKVYALSIEHPYYRRFKLLDMDEDYIASLIGDCDNETFSILLAHNPDYFENYSSWGADLTLSGHVHGGVVRIPYSKGLISPMIKLFPKYDGGEFNKNGKKLIVSRGLGMHTIPLRLFNPAEIVKIHIKKEK